MNVLTINAGSATVKFKLFAMDPARVLAEGMVDRIGEPSGEVRVQAGGRGGTRRVPLRDHAAAVEAAFEALRQVGALEATANLAAVGHRIVHGGESFRAPVRIDRRVLERIRALRSLAPLHNPVGVLGIEAAARLCPGTPQVAVFDTAFHQSMPPRAFMYALPYELYRKHGVRRYGFHGTSHAFVAARAAELLGQPLERLRLITLHLGNGASAAAIDGGRSIDTSMGMTPLEGLVMGSRCGDLDPSLPTYIGRVGNRPPAAVEDLLNRSSGLLGLCGAKDMREVHARADAGDERAQLAVELFCYRLRKYIGAYLAALGGADAVVFTGGIGEHDARVRALACEGLEALGITLDAEGNQATVGRDGPIHADDSRVRLLVVRTDEELAIARATAQVIGSFDREDRPS